jgi:ABC-type multidrug transport system permease subunit
MTLVAIAASIPTMIVGSLAAMLTLSLVYGIHRGLMRQLSLAASRERELRKSPADRLLASGVYIGAATILIAAYYSALGAAVGGMAAVLVLGIAHAVYTQHRLERAIEGRPAELIR